MFGLRPQEMILIALVILIFFGGKKLPEMGKGIGEAIKNFKKSIKSDESAENKAEKDQDKKLA
jgi:sec-independent protein translocase protein TatA